MQVPISRCQSETLVSPGALHLSSRHFAFCGCGLCPCRVLFPAARSLPAAGQAWDGSIRTHAAAPGTWMRTHLPQGRAAGRARGDHHCPTTAPSRLLPARNHGRAFASQKAVVSAAGTGLPSRNSRPFPMEACSYHQGCCSIR